MKKFNFIFKIILETHIGFWVLILFFQGSCFWLRGHFINGDFDFWYEEKFVIWINSLILAGCLFMWWLEGPKKRIEEKKKYE